MKKLWILLGLLSLFNNNVLQAQILSGQYEPDALNMEKYWYFRQRLVTRFVKIGPNPGESIPASVYQIQANEIWDPAAAIYKRIQFGADATSDLGWYIGVLATEIKLLDDAGEDISSSVEELWYALNAINRLDDVAELIFDYEPRDANGHEIIFCADRNDTSLMNPLYRMVVNTPQYQNVWDPVNKIWQPRSGSIWTSQQQNRNGFFIRGDGPLELLDYFTDADMIGTTVCRPVNTLDNLPDDKYWCCLQGAYPGINLVYRNIGYWKTPEESQDQLFHILMGLMLTVEFVDASVYSHSESIQNKACEIGVRLLDHYTYWYNITNPTYDSSNARNVCIGENSIAFEASLGHVKTYFNTCGNSKNNDNDQGYFWTTNEVNRSLYSVITAISNSTPHRDLCVYTTSDGFDWGFWYLLNRAIYPHPQNSDCDYDNNEIREDLDLCPCRGPFWDAFAYYDGTYRDVNGNFFNYNQASLPDLMPDKWNRSNCFIHKSNQGGTRGEFNGLDYMLLFNLAKIVTGNNGANEVPYTNMIHHQIHDPFPATASFTPVAFDEMTIDLTIPSNRRMEAKATSSITLLPGFNTSANSYFLAEIHDGSTWTCDQNTYKSSGVMVPLHTRDYDLNRETILNTFSSLPETYQTEGINSGLINESLVREVNSEFIVFPNPTNNFLTLRCEINRPVNVVISDLTGKIFLRSIIFCGSQISLGDISAGTYQALFTWLDENGQLYSYRELIIKTE